MNKLCLNESSCHGKSNIALWWTYVDITQHLSSSDFFFINKIY